MLKNNHQYLNTLKLYKEFAQALDYRQLNPDPDPLKQKLHLDSIMCQLEKFKEEINEYKSKITRSKI